ncbi:PEGA domain-containing protein [Sorangium cellulosum]|uniref:PEGA domain-containing protein n=1 Tax=Sorangium cellulosum TaxID=56 RepID=UPI003D9A85A5
MTASRALSRALILAASVFLPSAGHADTGASEAQRRLERSADRAVAEGQLAKARDLWLQVWQLAPSEKAACNVGQLAFRVGDMARAAEFLALCLERTPAPRSAAERERYASRALDLARVKQEVGALTFAVPPGAQLSIDGRPVGQAPLGREVYVEPGSHRVRAALGAAAKETTVEVRAGEARLLVLDLAPAAPVGGVAPAAPAGGVAPAAPAGGVAPAAPAGGVAPAAPAGAEQATPRALAPAGLPGAAGPAAPGSEGPATALVLLGGAATAGCISLGAIFLAEANGHQRRFDDLLARNHGGYRIAGAELQRAQSAYRAMGRAEERAAIALTAGALLGAGTLIYALLPRSRGPRVTAAGTQLGLEMTW